jgi:hypothetical protein
MKTKLFNERGQALILIALAAIGLFAIAGLAIDGSAKYADRRHAQNAADAAALAGALAKAKNPPDPLWNIVALDRALDNGYDDNHVSNEVEVYSPPISGYYAGNPSYVQVIITSYVNTYFARVIGITRTVNAVQAVALAKKGGPLGDGAMIISYDPDPNCSSGAGSGGGSVDVSGNGRVYLNGGGIFLNSDESCGFSIPNCAELHITAPAGINSAASVDNIDQDGCSTAAPEYTNHDPVIIPHDVEIPPEPVECGQLATAYNDPPGSDTWHITPGYYSDFPQANINGNIVGNKKHIIMDPGIYCVGKDIHWSGNTFYSLDGSSGVTIYLKEGFDFDLSINSPITLYASHTGSDYDGYIIIQDGSRSSIGSCTINGGAYLDIEGTVFAPYCDITVNGGSEPTATINAQLLGWDIKLNGNNTINFNYDPSKVAKITRRVGLMK